MKTKTTSLLILLAIWTNFNCAPGYRNITTYRPLDPSTFRTNDIEVTFARQPFGNNRFRKKAQKELIASYHLRVENNSPDTVYVDLSSIKLEHKNTILRPLSPESAAALLKYGRAGYWFWSLFWVAFTTENCSGNDCDRTVIPIPVGLGIAAAQFSKAGSSNKQMKREFTEKGLNRMTIPPASSEEGLLFFKGVSKREGTLILDLEQGQDNIERVHLPLVDNSPSQK